MECARRTVPELSDAWLEMERRPIAGVGATLVTASRLPDGSLRIGILNMSSAGVVWPADSLHLEGFNGPVPAAVKVCCERLP